MIQKKKRMKDGEQMSSLLKLKFSSCLYLCFALLAACTLVPEAFFIWCETGAHNSYLFKFNLNQAFPVFDELSFPIPYALSVSFFALLFLIAVVPNAFALVKEVFVSFSFSSPPSFAFFSSIFPFVIFPPGWIAAAAAAAAPTAASFLSVFMAGRPLFFPAAVVAAIGTGAAAAVTTAGAAGTTVAFDVRRRLTGDVSFLAFSFVVSTAAAAAGGGGRGGGAGAGK